jgi:hypothetical protein
MEQIELLSELKRLFSTAKKFDEFEFVNVLLGYNGMGDQHALTHLYESRSYIADMKAHFVATNTAHSKVRLGLHMYCHFFEMDELYNILGNLLRISVGQSLRYIPNLYNGADQFLTPSDKFYRLKSLAEESKFTEFLEGLEDLYKNELRNAFAHSAYSLIDDDFCIIRGNGIPIGNSKHQSIGIETYLMPLINRTINFIEAFFSHIDENKMAYSSNKIVEARMPDLQPVVILGDAKTGLIGFQTFVGSWLKIKQDYGSEHFVEAMNLTFNRGNTVNAELSTKLERYMEELTPVGKDFNSIRDAVLASGDGSLLHNLSVVYYNWANNTAATAVGKPERQQDAIYKSVIERYELAIQTDPSFGRAYHNKGTALLKHANSKNNLTVELREEVLALFDKTISLDKNMFEAWLNSARILLEIGNEEGDHEKQRRYFDESIKRCRIAIEIYPKDTEPFENLGWIYRRLARLSKDKGGFLLSAIDAHENSLKLKPNLRTSLMLGTVFGEYADISEGALKAYSEKAIGIFISSQDTYGFSTDLSYRLANRYLLFGKKLDDSAMLMRASECYNKALELDASNISAMTNWGHCELVQTYFKESVKEKLVLLESAKLRLEHVIGIDSTHAMAWYNLGLVFIDLAKFDESGNKKALLSEAIRNLQRMEVLEPKQASYDLARAYALLGDEALAIKWLKEWKTDPEASWNRIHAQNDFEGLKELAEFKQLAD